MLLSQPLTAPSMLSATDDLNSDLVGPFSAFLSATITDRVQHSRFLNLLSLLEHIGSRKIILSQMKGILTRDILKHLAEETRHAFFFKREAEKMAGHALKGYSDFETLAAGPGQFYFGRLDAGLSATLPNSHHSEVAYLWVSLVVELRALWVYRLYQGALTDAKSSPSLKGIIAEEDRHLLDMTDRLSDLGFETRHALPGALILERRLFQRLMMALTEASNRPTMEPARAT